MMTSAVCTESAQVEVETDAPNPETVEIIGAPGTTRTCDLRFRKPLLYPLSYGGNDTTTRSLMAMVAIVRGSRLRRLPLPRHCLRDDLAP